MRRKTEGAVLVMMLMSAVVFSILSYGMLTVAMSRSQQVEVMMGPSGLNVRYAAEAGLEFAKQLCMNDPLTPCFKPSTTDLIVNNLEVDIYETDPCPAPRLFKAKVTY